MVRGAVGFRSDIARIVQTVRAEERREGIDKPQAVPPACRPQPVVIVGVDIGAFVADQRSPFADAGRQFLNREGRLPFRDIGIDIALLPVRIRQRRQKHRDEEDAQPARWGGQAGNESAVARERVSQNARWSSRLSTRLPSLTRR